MVLKSTSSLVRPLIDPSAALDHHPTASIILKLQSSDSDRDRDRDNGTEKVQRQRSRTLSALTPTHPSTLRQANSASPLQTITAPLAAFCMASLLFVYARTSISAAKRNAQRHRDADGGQINWRNESLRRHGALERPEEQDTVGELLRGRKEDVRAGPVPGTEDDRIRERAGKGRG